MGGPVYRADKNAMASTTSHPTITNEATAPAVILAFLLWCKDAFNASVGGLNLSSSGMRPELSPNLGDGRAGQAAAVVG